MLDLTENIYQQNDPPKLKGFINTILHSTICSYFNFIYLSLEILFIPWQDSPLRISPSYTMKGLYSSVPHFNLVSFMNWPTKNRVVVRIWIDWIVLYLARQYTGRRNVWCSTIQNLKENENKIKGFIFSLFYR